MNTAKSASDFNAFTLGGVPTPTNGRVCSQEVMEITVLGTLSSQAVTYRWARDNALVLNTTASLSEAITNTTNNLITVTYSCLITPSGGPPVTRTIVITVAPASPPIVIRNANPTLCVQQTGLYNLAGLVPTVVSNPNEIHWSGSPFITVVADFNGGPNNYFFDTRAARAQGTQHTLLVSNRSGSPFACFGAPATINLTLLDGPVFEIRVKQPLSCAGEKVVLTAYTGPVFGNPVSYVWQPGNLTSQEIVVMPLVSTTYTAIATNAAGCTYRQTVRVNVQPATCPVCAPAVVQMNPVVNGTTVTGYHTGYTFKTGSTYYFSASTELTNGTYVAEPGSRLLFGPEVYLTLTQDGCLQLQGAQFTATCDKQWGGIRIKDCYGIMATNNGGRTNEISHSTEGIVLTADIKNWTNKNPCYTLTLDGVQFLNNTRSVQLQTGAGEPGMVNIVDCTFDADPAQMLVPYAYRSATEQACAYAHLSLTGDVSNLTLSRNTFDHALFGIWAPDADGLTASRNAFSNCYVAGVFNLFNGSPSTWTDNTFAFPRPDNDFMRLPNPFVVLAYDDLAALPDVPSQIAAPGNCVGLCASGDPLTVSSGSFRQSQRLTAYDWSDAYPQIGLWAGPGQVLLQASVFENLHKGYVGQAQQGLVGQVKGNTFIGCQAGVSFLNRRNAGAATSAVLTCNTFQRPPSTSGDSYGVYLGPCPYTAGQPCDQIDISGAGSAVLQTNLFTGTLPPVVGRALYKFWHVFNDRDNSLITYTHYDAGTPGSRVAGDATVVGDDGSTTAAPFASVVQLTFNSPNSITLNNGNNCASRGYPATGLQRPSVASNTPPASYQLAQNVPNPCTVSTSVSYRVPTGSKSAQLVVRDCYSGRVWKREDLAVGEHTLEMPVAALPPGAYHYSLEVDGRPVAHHQLLVQ